MHAIDIVGVGSLPMVLPRPARAAAAVVAELEIGAATCRVPPRKARAAKLVHVS